MNNFAEELDLQLRKIKEPKDLIENETFDSYNKLIEETTEFKEQVELLSKNKIEFLISQYQELLKAQYEVLVVLSSINSKLLKANNGSGNKVNDYQGRVKTIKIFKDYNIQLLAFDKAIEIVRKRLEEIENKFGDMIE